MTVEQPNLCNFNQAYLCPTCGGTLQTRACISEMGIPSHVTACTRCDYVLGSSSPVKCKDCW